MTFNVPSFFAGIATVLLTLTVGFGGGVLMTGVFSDRGREQNKVERRAADDIKPAPVPAASPVSAPVEAQSAPAAPVQAQVASPAPSALPAQSAPAPQPEPVNSAAQVASSPSQPASAPPTRTASEQPLGAQRPVALTQPDAQPQPRDLHEASKAREAKARAEKRKAERRKQLAERRQQQLLREEQQKTMSERLRREDPEDEDRDERPLFGRRDRLFEAPVFRLFDARE